MLTKIQKWGNSQGLRLAREVLDGVHISVGDEVEVSSHNGVIVITPVKRVRGRRNLPELLSQIPADYPSEVVDWGKPEGREAW